MEWLHNQLDEFEVKETERKKKDAEERAALEKERSDNRRNASELLGNVYKYFVAVKKELTKRKYPCDADLKTCTEVSTNQQYNTETSLVVNLSALRQGEKLSSAIYPHITFKEIYGKASLSVVFRVSGSDQPTSREVPFTKLDDAFIEDMTKEFINKLFAPKR